jgi:L-seryl-tRNA(Ser) seleniumtransferase
LPVDLLPSYALAVTANNLKDIAKSLRGLPRPVIGRIAHGQLLLDCRCLEQGDEAAFVAQFG